MHCTGSCCIVQPCIVLGLNRWGGLGGGAAGCGRLLEVSVINRQEPTGHPWGVGSSSGHDVFAMTACCWLLLVAHRSSVDWCRSTAVFLSSSSVLYSLTTLLCIVGLQSESSTHKILLNYMTGL
jgi:hypothetical protein